MRLIQIYIDDDLDDALRAEAERRGVSKASLIRASVRREFPPPAEAGAVDPWADMVGWLDGGPVDDIDEVVYGSPA